MNIVNKGKLRHLLKKLREKDHEKASTKRVASLLLLREESKEDLLPRRKKSRSRK